MKKLVVLAALALHASPALAQDGGGEAALLFKKDRGIESAMDIKGKCSKFEVGGIKYPCKLALYTHFSNGRTAIQFDIRSGAVMFSGGPDSQIDPRRYTLNVDRISVGRGDGSTQPYPAKGKCTVILKDLEANYVRSINCKASNGTERVNVEFQAIGKVKKL